MTTENLALQIKNERNNIMESKKSPIQLTPEQQKERDKTRLSAFIKEYKEVEKKHQLTFGAFLDVTVNGIKPAIRVINLDELQKKEKEA